MAAAGVEVVKSVRALVKPWRFATAQVHKVDICMCVLRNPHFLLAFDTTL